MLSTTTIRADGTLVTNVARDGLAGAVVDAMGHSPAGDLAFSSSPPQLLLGHVTSAALAAVPLEAGGVYVGVATHIAWDGEAFTIDLRQDGTLLTTRRSASGEVVLPPTPFGVMGALSYVGYDLGYKSSTNAVSGRTFAFSATSGRVLAGHERNGDRISWIPESGALDLTPPPCDGSDGWGVVCGAGASLPAVAADPEGGVWLAWGQATTRQLAKVGGVQHLDRDGKPGPFIWYRTPEGDQGGADNFALYAYSATEALLVASSGTALYVYDVDGPNISEPRIVTTHVPEPTANEGFRELELLTDGSGLTWLVFEQDQRVRSLKVAPGCVYPPDPDPASVVTW